MSKTKKEAAFDVESAINDLQKSGMFKAGLRFYIQSSNITIKNEKDFEKTIKNYTELKIGG